MLVVAHAAGDAEHDDTKALRCHVGLSLPGWAPLRP
jgi:hypothetical protein